MSYFRIFLSRSEGVCVVHIQPLFLPVDILHNQCPCRLINPRSRDTSYVVTKLRHRDTTLPRMQAVTTVCCNRFGYFRGAPLTFSQQAFNTNTDWRYPDVIPRSTSHISSGSSLMNKNKNSSPVCGMEKMLEVHLQKLGVVIRSPFYGGF